MSSNFRIYFRLNEVQAFSLMFSIREQLNNSLTIADLIIIYLLYSNVYFSNEVK